MRVTKDFSSWRKTEGKAKGEACRSCRLAAWTVHWQGGTASHAAAPLVWHFDRWCANLAVSLALAFVLWRQGLWGGGDAKLFICYAALTPLAVYPVVFFDSRLFGKLFLRGGGQGPSL